MEEYYTKEIIINTGVCFQCAAAMMALILDFLDVDVETRLDYTEGLKRSIEETQPVPRLCKSCGDIVGFC